MAGNLYEGKVTDERSRRLESAFMHFGDTAGEGSIRPPMPGPPLGQAMVTASP